MLKRAALVALLAVGCQSAPEDLREWRPSDHDHPTPAAGAPAPRGQVPRAPASAAPPRPGLDEVTLVTWRRNCVTCHGQLGRGDGPQAPMTQPRDLTDPGWQASVTDEAIRATIRQGRGKMPGFSLPASTVDGLVQLIRLLGGAHAGGPPTAPAASTAPQGSAGALPTPDGPASARSPSTAASAPPGPSASRP